MRLVDLREDTSTDAGKRVIATAVWERRNRGPQDIVVAVDQEHEDMLGLNPDAFLVGAIWPAMYNFEKRIFVEGDLDPALVDNLTRAMALVNDWYRDAKPIAIVGDILSKPRSSTPGAKAALMFSGGLDSLASLRLNRENHTPVDEEWFRYGLVLGSGFDAFDAGPRGAYWPELTAMADDAGLRLVPLATNLRELEPADHFFEHYLHAALLAMVGHSLIGEINRLAIASTSPDTCVPWGSRPDLDPLYSSGALTVIHDLAAMERHDKTAAIADWSILHDRLRVCLYANRLPPGTWNCSACEKCLRTMLSLAALGRLDDFKVFDASSLTPERIESLRIRPSSLRHYPALVGPLERAGLTPLAQSVRSKLSSAGRRNDGRGLLRQVDRRLLGGAIRRTKRRLLG